MLKIFDKNHNAIGHIVKYKDCKIESELSTGDKTLSFTYLACHHNLTNEMYVRTKDDEFVIKEVPGTTGSFPQIVAVLNLEDLQKDMWKTFSVTDVTIDEAVRTVLAGTGWTIGECNVTKRRNAGMMQVSSLDVIQNLCNAFMCEPVFDTINKKVSFYIQRGEDKGVYFMSGLNLKKLQKKSTSYDYYTRIIPIGANGLTIESVNDGKNYLENYQYSNKPLTYIWKDESYTDAQALKDDAELKLNDLSKPTLSYSADVRDLAKQKTEYAILSYGLGDNITLIDRETGTRDKQRIVKLVEYPQNPEKNTCELANTVLTFEEMQQKVQDAANIINFTVAGDGRYTGTINVSDILHFEQGVAGSTTVSGISNSISTMQGEMAQVKMTVGELDANCIRADEADLKYATIGELTVTNETVYAIQGDYASFKSTVTDEFAATNANITNLSGQYAAFEKTTTEELITAKGWMLEGAIGDAQISSVTANKIRSGTIDTALVTVAGSDGRLQISDNTIQISDSNRVRVQVGKDASGDYTLAVWDSDGKLIWDALGATENTIQRKIIRDKMVADDAAIQALKLDLQSFNTALTKQGVTISGTVVQVGNKTLNVALTEQIQLVTSHGEMLTDHATRITANEGAISLRVTTQEYQSYKSTVNGELESAKSRLITAESSITALNGQIDLKVEQTDIDTAVSGIQVGGRNLVLNSKTVTLVRSDSTNNWLLPSPTWKNSAYGIELLEKGGKFTISFDYSITGITTACNMSVNLRSTSTNTHSRVGNLVPLSVGDNSGHFECTFTPTEGMMQYGTQWLISGIGAGQNGGAEFTFTNTKFEKGTKATDWSPAPEDVDASISAVYAKFANYSTTTQMQAAITAEKDSITSSVSQTYATKSEVSTISGKVTSMESWKSEASQKITKDGIVATVGNYYAKDSDLSTVRSDLASTEAKAEQTATKFSWIVKSGTSESNMVLTDTLYNLVAQNINLTGKVTFSCLDSAAQQKITTAQSTADSAKTAAANAQSTADTAKSNAATAQSTANTAKTNAATAQSTADTAKSNANTANSTANAVKSTVDAGKSNWDSAYSWTSSNGSNMTSLLSMVKKWTNNAVSDTTTIQGGWIATNTITANKLALADFNNYATVNENYSSSFSVSSAYGTPDLSDGYITKKTATNEYLPLNGYTPNIFHTGDQIYFTFKAKASSAGTFTAVIGGRNSDKSYLCINGYDVNLTTEEKTYSGVIKLTSTSWDVASYFIIGLRDKRDTKAQVYLRDVKFMRRSGGELIVDGAITTDKLAANAVTADKINTTDLFAQDITATGSITGVTLNGATVNSTSGNIGGWEIESGALKSGGDTYNFSGSTIINQMTTSQITKRGVYLNASAGMARFVNCESNYKESAGMYFNTVRETRIVGGTTTGYKATYDYLYSNNFASFSGDVTVEDWSGTLRKPVTSINNSQYCVSHFQSNSSSLTVTGAWAGSELSSRSITVTSSDIRLKENIRQTEVEALPIINQIGLYQFDWKQDGLHQKIGFIADYLEQQDEHFSVGGGYDDDGIMNVKAVDNFYLMGYVVKGMQELSTMATRADARLRDVETVAYSAKTEVDSINAKVSSLEYQLQQAYMRIATLEKQLQAVG